ncbi:hypothetical protein [Streptomyces adelaidensis]|uniref:hypothetical protein n=1 Tax=Streptomyces adelaidensis TaxID=2796465 RepID=UPI0019061466|nr:hypothetical protein [Streptomyces adelaidensis]
MADETVYDADTWPVVACSERLPELRDWLRANGIDPGDVPVHEDITIEPLTLGGDRAIRFTAHLRNADGCKYLDEATGEAAQEERTVPLVVEPPPQWRTEKENDG